MARSFPIAEPKEFLSDFVRRAYDEYRDAPLDAFRVKTAIHQMNVMAERVWKALYESLPESVGNAKSAGEYRRYLAQRECADFQLVWDVDDAHKHVRLGRPSAAVSSASQSGIRREGGAIGSMPLGAAPLGGTIDEFVIILNDGTERRVSDILLNVMGMWERLFP